MRGPRDQRLSAGIRLEKLGEEGNRRRQGRAAEEAVGGEERRGLPSS